MSITRSDNEQTNHPKPEFEHYLFLNTGTGVYRDYADQAEVKATNNLAFRKNKSFRIAGQDYFCHADGETFTVKGSVGGGGGSGMLPPEYYDLTGGESFIAVPNIGDFTDALVIRGMTVQKQIKVGSTLISGEFRIDAPSNRIYFGDPGGNTELVTVVKIVTV